MSSRKILLADDDKDMHVLVKKYFPEPDYEWISSFDGEQAYELVKAKKPDLVILDVLMPKMDGRDVLRKLQEDEATSKIPIIILSIKDEQVDRRLGLELGAEDYVAKPCDFEHLARKIRYKLLQREQNGLNSVDIVEGGDRHSSV